MRRKWYVRYINTLHYISAELAIIISYPREFSQPNSVCMTKLLQSSSTLLKILRPLLGRAAAEKLKLDNRVDTFSKTTMASKHPQLFTGLGQMKETYIFTLKEDAKPFAISFPRRTGVISPVDQPADWCAPMVVTRRAIARWEYVSIWAS